MLIETVAELHDANMDLLRKFDEFCRAHDVHYFIAFGTLLGAVRHQDIIPWDDDIDVVMTRSEYNKLIKVPKQKYPEGCELITPGQDEQFIGFAPMFKDNTHVGKTINVSDSPSGDGTARLGIDIFILDPSYTGLRHKILTYRQLLIYAQARAHRPFQKPLDVKNGNFVTCFVASFFESIGKRRKLYRLMEKFWKISTNLKTDGTVLYSPCNSPKDLYQEYKAEWFAETVYLNLGGMECPSPAMYDECLTCMFGDYMELPPESARRPEHFLLKEYQDQ